MGLVPDLLVAIALAHLAAVGVEDDRQMPVDRPGIPKRLLQRDVIDRIEQVLLPAQHVGDAHFRIIHDDGKVKCRYPIGLADNEILDLIRPKHDLLAQHNIGESIFLDRHGEADDRWPALGFIFAESARR